MTMTQEERNERIESLKTMFPKGSVVNCVEMKTGNGYSDFMVIVPLANSGAIGDISANVAKVTGHKLTPVVGYIRVKGFGTSRSGELVADLSKALYDELHALKEHCLR